MKSSALYFSVIVTGTLAACVSSTAPVAMGKDTYMITTNAHGGFQSDGALLTGAIKQAGDFCTAQGKEVDIQSTQSSGVQGWTPQNNQVVFHCLSKNDPAYTVKNFEPKADVVIETKQR